MMKYSSFIASMMVIFINDVTPRDIVVLVHDTLYVRCSPNVSIDIQWHFNSLLEYVYAGGRFFIPYKGRFSLDANETTGTYILKVPDVRLEDAGWYYCSEELSGRMISSTQVTVLNSRPVCNSNIESDGFVGPNTCNLELENITINCAVSFSGPSPHLLWRFLNETQPINNSLCENKPNRMNCSMTLKAEPSLDGSVVVCQTSSTSGPQHDCHTEIIKVHHFSTEFVTATKNASENVSCIVRSNRNVRYNWTSEKHKLINVFSANPTTIIHEPGIYRCEAEYSIRNASCSAVVSVVNFIASTADLEKGNVSLLFSIVSAMIVVILVAVLAFLTVKYLLKRCVFRKYRRRPKKMKTVDVGCGVWGLALLNDELFVALLDMGCLYAIKAQNLDEFLRRVEIEGAYCPRDVVSCESKNCLFVASPPSIFRIDSRGEILKKWDVPNEPNNLSVTSSETLIVTCKDKILEYSSDGELLQGINLETEAFDVSWHSVLLNSGNFHVCQGWMNSTHHRVLTVNAEGKLLRSYGSVASPANTNLHNPVYLTTDRDGFLLVADSANHRIVLLSPALTFSECLITHKHGIYEPYRILLDETAGFLYVGTNAGFRGGAIHIFKVFS